MTLRTRIGFVFLLFAQALSGCDRSGSTSSPGAPSPVTVPPAPLRSFVESSTGFSTTDVRDVDDQIIQVNTANELIWTADGTRLTGYSVWTFQGTHGVVTYIEGSICSGCYVFEVRFGTAGGERRAYLTVDYGHDNPGTLVDVEVAGGRLVVTPTDVFAPGSYTLSGVVTEVENGRVVPLAGVSVYRGMTTGWQEAKTDQRGVYTLRGMYASNDDLGASADGYEPFLQAVPITGDKQFDIRLVRR
jgi:hypothetical protein